MGGLILSEVGAFKLGNASLKGNIGIRLCGDCNSGQHRSRNFARLTPPQNYAKIRFLGGANFKVCACLWGLRRKCSSLVCASSRIAFSLWYTVGTPKSFEIIVCRKHQHPRQKSGIPSTAQPQLRTIQSLKKSAAFQHQFSILHSPLSILNCRKTLQRFSTSILHFPFSIFNFRKAKLFHVNSQFSILNFPLQLFPLPPHQALLCRQGRSRRN